LVGFSSTTRVISTDDNAEVMPDTSESSAFTAIGWVICHEPLSFLSAVDSPLAELTLISSILSDSREAKTFSCFLPESPPAPPGGCFQVTK
jgi:hypothetical protein